jgi:glycosyltransferase involved in cell wall biosynthesis
MVPPVIACIPIWLYCVCTKSRFAIDAHTAAILMKRWQKVFFIQRFFSKMAAVTIVTNTHLEKKIKEKKINIIIVRDLPIIESVLPHSKSIDESKILVVCSFQSNDEPIIEILVAASKFPSINFYITGDYSKISNTIKHSIPPNVHFTGFLSREKYISHMQTSCIIIALTTRNFTMQRGAYEAIYLGKPVITSNFPLLIESFCKGAIHVRPDAKGIQNGINMALEKVEELTDQAIELKIEKIKIWENNKSNLSRLLMHP